MSREPKAVRTHVLTGAALLAALAGCGRDGARRDAARATGGEPAPTGLGVSTVGRAAADSRWHAPGAQAGAGAVAAPTPGFTSARGTPPSDTVASAAAAVAARVAPPPPAALTRALGADEQAAVARLPAGAGHDLVVGNCLICHAATMLEQQHKDTAGWNKTVTQMVAWGAPVPAGNRPVLVAYLAAHYAARAAGSPARQVP